MQRTVLRATNPTRALRALTLALVASFALAACGGGEEPAPAATTPAPAAGPAATTAAPAATTPAPAPQVAKLPVPELLKRATAAVGEDRLVSPAADNAIEYYLAVIEEEPNNVQATQALVDLFPLAASIAERAIAQRDVPEAKRIVALLERASPDSYTVSTIKTKVDQLEQTLVREEERRVAQEQAAAAAAQQAAQQAAQREAAPPEPARPAPAPAPAEPPPTQVAAVTPPPAQTPAPQPVAPPAETRDAQILRSVQPAYPPEAVRKRQEGWVELSFTVGADGRVSDVSVVRAQPMRVFDREAIRAMQQSTFRPALRNGQPVASQRRQRIEFNLGG